MFFLKKETMLYRYYIILCIFFTLSHARYDSLPIKETTSAQSLKPSLNNNDTVKKTPYHSYKDFADIDYLFFSLVNMSLTAYPLLN